MAFRRRKSLFRGEAGQILLIVILVIVVVSTIGLSLASRSVTSLRTSTEEAESQKALAAAEAGIERVLQSDVEITIEGNSPENSNYTASTTQVSGDRILLNGGIPILKNEGIDLWLSTYNPDPASNYSSPQSGNVTIYWGDSANACDNSALEIILVLGPKTNPTSKRYAYDPCLTRRDGASGNNFLPASSGGTINASDGTPKTFSHGATISGISSGLIARIIPIYKDTVVGADAEGFGFPNQGFQNDATGTSGEANRKIRVFKGWPQTFLPYLSYGLFVAN